MKAHLTSFGLPQADGCESHDAFAVKAWDETVIAVLADAPGPRRRPAKRPNARFVRW